MEVVGSCSICPRRCGVSRGDGFCGAGADVEIASVCLHRGEEPPISGSNGIVNIFFAHCNLQCIYCQNWQISGRGEVRAEKLSDSTIDRICSMLPEGNPMLGFVTAAHFAYAVEPIVEAVRKRGFNPTVVYNSGGYESVETLRRLEGVVDVYLPDLKYMDSGLAALYSHAPDYPEVAAAALLEMKRQVGGGLKMDDDGMAYRGMLVRHLVLPGAGANTEGCLQWLADNMPFSTGISLMAQYFPPSTTLPPPLDRPLMQEEYDRAQAFLSRLPFSNVWTQELSAQDCYRPDFSSDTPFTPPSLVAPTSGTASNQ